MRRRRDRAGVAALEFALVAPVLIMLLVAATDFGAAMISRARISRALASAAEYATIAGQAAKLSNATIATNAQVYAAGVSSSVLGTATTTATLNNGAASGTVCCPGAPGATWTCSTTTGYICADKSPAGVYLTITAKYPFTPLFPADSLFVGKTLSDSVVAPLQ